jgi:hypothetical protein
MSIRDSLIEAAARACSQEGISVDKAAAVFLRKLNPDGGFRGKGPQSDLYYTGFALMSLKALGQTLEIPKLLDFLMDLEGKRSRFGPSGGADSL